MKYILLGTIDSKWLNKQSERYTKSSEKLKKLGIKLENVKISATKLCFS